MLKHRLGEVDDIVDDDVGYRRRQIENSLGEVGQAVERRVEGEAGAGRDVMDELRKLRGGASR